MAVLRARWLPLALTALLVIVTALLIARGYSFYALSLEDRVEHPEFRVLRPSGSVGNGYGWVATLLVVLNLSYLVRRRLAATRLGSMRVWLDVHVFTGLLAAVLASFHSAFQARSTITTTSAISLGVVVVTGLLGRLMYALAPVVTARSLADALAAVEREVPGLAPQYKAAVDALPSHAVPANPSLVRSLLAMPRWRRVVAARREALAVITPPGLDRPARQAAARFRGLDLADARSSGMAALLRSWRGFHRFFALLMLVAVLLHAGIAWHYGYRWIFA